jgi:hypothetical protein
MMVLAVVRKSVSGNGEEKSQVRPRNISTEREKSSSKKAGFDSCTSLDMLKLLSLL